MYPHINIQNDTLDFMISHNLHSRELKSYCDLLPFETTLRAQNDVSGGMMKLMQ
jgi:hypothetical protein